MRELILAEQLTIVPANEASRDDLEAVFGAWGQAARCQCQRYKLRRRESFASFPVEERAYRLRQQTDCGHPESYMTSGLVAYLDGEPVGWCAVEPRTAYGGLLRKSRALGGSPRGQDRRRRLGCDVLAHSRRLPEAWRQPSTRGRCGGLRPGARRARHRGLPHHRGQRDPGTDGGA